MTKNELKGKKYNKKEQKEQLSKIFPPNKLDKNIFECLMDLKLA